MIYGMVLLFVISAVLFMVFGLDMMENAATRLRNRYKLKRCGFCAKQTMKFACSGTVVLFDEQNRRLAICSFSQSHVHPVRVLSAGQLEHFELVCSGQTCRDQNRAAFPQPAELLAQSPCWLTLCSADKAYAFRLTDCHALSCDRQLAEQTAGQLGRLSSLLFALKRKDGVQSAR